MSDPTLFPVGSPEWILEGCARLRACYFRCRRVWELRNGGVVRLGPDQGGPLLGHTSLLRYDGGRATTGGRLKPCPWPAILCRCPPGPRESYPDAAGLARSLFAGHDGQLPPYPASLGSSRTLAHYAVWKDQALEQQAVLLASEQALGKSAYLRGLRRFPDQPELALRSVVLDEGNHLSCLFRYTLASQEGALAEAERLLPGALVQYLYQPELYDRVWGRRLPAELRTQGLRRCQADLERSREILGAILREEARAGLSAKVGDPYQCRLV